MSTNEARSQDSTAVVIADDDAEVVDDTPNWEGPLAEYDHYGEPTERNYVRRPVCGVGVLDGEMSTASRRPACRHK